MISKEERKQKGYMGLFILGIAGLFFAVTVKGLLDFYVGCIIVPIVLGVGAAFVYCSVKS